MAAKEHKSLQGSKILLIEDDKSIRLTVTQSLVSKGFEVLNFKNGSSALDFILGALGHRFESSRPDCILRD